MKYAKEVINLLAAYPGREFTMAHIVRFIDPQAQGRDRQRIRNGVLRVLQTLREGGSLKVKPQPRRGMQATYTWMACQPFAANHEGADSGGDLEK